MKKRGYVCCGVVLLALFSGCSGKGKEEKNIDASAAEIRSYTLDYADNTMSTEDETDAETELVEISYYEDLLKKGTYKWGDPLKPVNMLPEFDSLRFTNYFSPLIYGTNARDGFNIPIVQSGVVWVGSQFLNSTQTFGNYGDPYDTESPARFFVSFMHACGCCNLQLLDGENNVVWEKKNASEFFVEYIDLDPIPDGLYGYIEDCTPEEDAENIRYAVEMHVAAKGVD